MALIAAKILVGFVVGVLIGLSGVGGGVLLLPVLIFGLRVPAIVAVGSDALFNFFTKIPASLLHLKQGHGTRQGRTRAGAAAAFRDRSPESSCSCTSATSTATASTTSSRPPSASC